MNPNFSEWYLLVDPQPTDDKLKKRWTAIEKLCKGVSRETQLDLVKIAFQLVPKPAECTASFIKPFKDADAAFRIRDNNEEQSLLAAAAIAHLFKTLPPDQAIPLALGTACASLQGNRGTKATEHVGISKRADNLLREISARNRRELFTPKTKATPLDIKQDLEGVTQQAAQNEIPAAIKNLASAVQSAAAKLNSLLELSQHALRRQELFEEELDVMWWLQSGTSWDRKMSFEHMKAEERPVVAGKELADHTRVLPGPLAISAFLARAIRASGDSPETKASLEEAVDSTDNNWRKMVTGEKALRQLEPICPIHAALLESARTSTWQEAFSNVALTNPATKLRLVDLGLQTYRECLLLRPNIVS